METVISFKLKKQKHGPIYVKEVPTASITTIMKKQY